MPAIATERQTVGQIDDSGVTCSRIYQVRPANNEAEALGAIGLPAYGSVHPRFDWLFLFRLTARQQQPDADRITWSVVAEYRPAAGTGAGGIDPNTGLPRNRVTFRTEITGVPFESAFSDGNATKVPDVPVVNTLNERPDPPLEIPKRSLVLVCTCFYLAPDLQAILELQGTTNNAEVQIGGVVIEKHGAVLRSAVPRQYETGQEDDAWSIEYEIVKTPAFIEFWNMSFNQQDPEIVPAVAIKPILDANGDPVNEPQHININGQHVTDPAAFHLIRLRYAPEVDWSTLDLPPDVVRQPLYTPIGTGV